MSGFLLHREVPPPAREIAPGVVMRLDGINEVDPQLMHEFRQEYLPTWDMMRIVRSRADQVQWMHDHFAEKVLGAGEPPEDAADYGGPQGRG